MFTLKRQDINMIEGPLLGKMIRYAIPIILTNLLQFMNEFCPK